MAFGLLRNWPSTIIVLVLIATNLADSFVSGQVTVQPNTALLNEGDPTELLCRHGGPIKYCSFEIPGENVLQLSPDWNTVQGFNYHGAGLLAGECGISIERVKATNNGQIKCSLGLQDQQLSGIINLVVSLRPKQPVITPITEPERDGYFLEGTPFRAVCVVRDGRPAANISWYLDDMPANKPLRELDIRDSYTDRNMTLSTTQQEIQWTLRPEDNGRRLICRSHHQTDRESTPPQEVAYTLLVHFAPVRQEEILVYGLYLERTASINVTIKANPKPHIEWTVDGVVLPQASVRRDGRFEAAEPQPLGDDLYNVTLIVSGLTLEDTAKTYSLKASNEFGSTDYTVRISSSQTPPTAGLDVGAIVGIVVAIAVLVLIVLLVVFARATGRWCFGGKSIKSPANETKTNNSSMQNLF